MEAAFGLAVTLTMLMSTALIAAYLYSRRVSIVAVILLTSMFLGRGYRRKLIVFEKMEPFVQTLKELSNDKSLPQYASRLIYLTTSDSPERIETELVLSILQRAPKRADVYWFINVETDDEPFTMRYKAPPLAKE